MIVLALSPLLLAAPLWACTYCYPFMTQGCQNAERLVIGSPLEVETFTMSPWEETRYLRGARVLLERTVTGPAAPDTVTLVGIDSARVAAAGMCTDELTNAYETGARYLIRLEPELAPGTFQAPLIDPGLWRLEAASSPEELVFLEYAAYVTENHRTPHTVHVEVDTEAVAGGPVMMRLTVRNDLSLPLQLLDRPERPTGQEAAVCLGLSALPWRTVQHELYALRDVGVTVAPGEERTLQLDLGELFGANQADTYEVRGWTTVPMAPGRGYRDGWGLCNEIVKFTVGPRTSVGPQSWGAVKESCCR